MHRSIDGKFEVNVFRALTSASVSEYIRGLMRNYLFVRELKSECYAPRKWHGIRAIILTGIGRVVFMCNTYRLFGSRYCIVRCVEQKIAFCHCFFSHFEHNAVRRIQCVSVHWLGAAQIAANSHCKFIFFSLTRKMWVFIGVVSLIIHDHVASVTARYTFCISWMNNAREKIMNKLKLQFTLAVPMELPRLNGRGREQMSVWSPHNDRWPRRSMHNFIYRCHHALSPYVSSHRHRQSRPIC